MKRIISLCIALMAVLLIVPSRANAVNDLDWKLVCKEKLNAVVCGNGTYVAVGDGGIIQTSKNGTDWKKVKSGVSTALNGVFWSGERFIAIGNNGIILSSKDAVSWQKRNSGTQVSLRKAAGRKKQYVIVGDRGVILYSKDGEKWNSVKSETHNSLWGVTANDKLFVAVGEDSTIISSTDGVRWKVSGSMQYSGRLDYILEGISWNGNTFNIVGYTKGKSYPVYLFSSTAQSWFPETIDAVGREDMAGIRLLGIAWDGTQNIAIGSRGSILTLSDCHKCRKYRSISDKDLRGIATDADKVISVGAGGIFVSKIDARIQSITPEIASGHIALGAYLIDVRNIDEYSGKHIPKSVNIPLDQLEDKISRVVPDKGKEIIVYCAKGVRSRKAAELLVKLGYTKVFNLGGIDKWPFETEANMKS